MANELEQAQCLEGVTRDDIRHYLFKKQAGVTEPAKEDAGLFQHLEAGKCEVCSREKTFLEWTEPGLTPRGKMAYEKMMNSVSTDLEIS